MYMYMYNYPTLPSRKPKYSIFLDLHALENVYFLFAIFGIKVRQLICRNKTLFVNKRCSIGLSRILNTVVMRDRSSPLLLRLNA